MRLIPIARHMLVLLAACGCSIALSSLAHFPPLTVSSHGLQAEEPTVTRIKDPLAVEPWSVALTASEAIVTNYASDNITIINRTNNTIQNIPVGDGPGGVPDGPFGVVDALGVTCVTLFGSNAVPIKGAPTDYSNVGPGRVQVLSQESDGTYRPLTQISVGKGPRFPALLLGRCKLYVPCGGADRVDVIDVTRNQKINEIRVGRDPSSCAISIDSSKLYVTNFGDGTVSVIDIRTDTKIKDIPAPRVVMPGVSDVPLAQYPWTAAISGANGNLYVTYWGTAGDASPNGAIVEIDTCSDEVIRVIVEDSTRGTRSGNSGPGAAVTDGGGPFGIASCRPGLFFTNDGLGLVGLLDARIDKVISPQPAGLASCQKPRGISCWLTQRTPAPDATFERVAYVACGQPDNEVLVIRAPDLPENIPNVPVIESFDYGRKIKITGRGFMPGARVEAFLRESPGCLTFARAPKVKNGGTLLIQKGALTNGRKLKPDVNEDDEGILFRIVNPDGSARMVNASQARPVRACRS